MTEIVDAKDNILKNVQPQIVDAAPDAVSNSDPFGTNLNTARINQQQVLPVSVKPRNVNIINQIPLGSNNDGSPAQGLITLRLPSFTYFSEAINFEDTTTTGLTSAKFLFTTYIDKVDGDHLYPPGGAINANVHSIQILDSANSFTVLGGIAKSVPLKPNEYTFWLYVTNGDTVSHIYYFYYVVRFISNSN